MHLPLHEITHSRKQTMFELIQAQFFNLQSPNTFHWIVPNGGPNQNYVHSQLGSKC